MGVAGLVGLLSYRWTILEALLVGFGLFYINITNQPVFVWLFFSVEDQDHQDIDKYAVNDLSFRR